MQVNGPSYIHAPQSINAPHTTRAGQGVAASNTPAKITDELQLSSAGQLADQLASIPDIRQDKINSLRAAIASGTYDTNERMSGALDRLLDEIG